MVLLAAIVTLAWIYLAFLHGRYWITSDKELGNGPPRRLPRVAVIVPARNEADVIARCIYGLLAQDYAGDLHVFLVDDNSEDGTAAAANSTSSRLTIVSGKPLPSGWTGKVWAMQQGWIAAQAFDPEMILLTDADIVHPPGTLSRLVAKSEEGFDLVSLMVRLHCQTIAERLLIPAFVYFFFLLYPPAYIADRHRQVAGAAGGCILVRAQHLRMAGAFDSLQGEIIDDCALARVVKRGGGRLWLGLADSSISIRPYEGLSGIVRMISRTAFNQLQHSLLLLFLCLIGMVWIFMAPLTLLFSATIVKLLALIALALMTVTYIPLTRYYRAPWWTVLTLPLAAVIYLYATFLSAFDYYRGAGGRWKERAQDPVQP